MEGRKSNKGLRAPEEPPFSDVPELINFLESTDGFPDARRQIEAEVERCLAGLPVGSDMHTEG